MRNVKWATLLVAVAVIAAASSAGAQEFKLNLGGAVYTKWLWGSQRYDGSMYSFTTVPGEGYGDNGQANELELFINAKVSKQVEVKARIHSRFNQNQWTNFGGWGGNNPPTVPCIGGDCGEFDSRSNQYIKLRGATVLLTPGYSWLDLATIGASDLGMFDPYTVGKIRYIDRDNASGIFFQGRLFGKNLHYDLARISLPRLWAGPNWETGEYSGADAAYALQLGYTGSSVFDITGVGYYVNDIEVDSEDIDWDDGRDVRTRFRDTVVGLKVGIHPGSVFDISAKYYASTGDTACDLGPCTFGPAGGYSSIPAGHHDGDLWKLNLDINDPFGVGLSFQLEGFDIAEDYMSIMAARREADVVLTEGYDSAYALPDPDNSTWGIWPGNPSRIGFGGWDGNAQQVATINVDNEFADFDEPMAETAMGWKGFTIVPIWSIGDLELQAEYTMLDYNTNWDVWGDPTGDVNSTEYPTNEPLTGVGHPYRSAYQPFQDKETDIYLAKFKYVIDVGKGIDLFGKIKFIDETDKRMNDERYLPYQPGDCPGGGVDCANNANYYYSEGGVQYSTSGLYYNPTVITGAGGEVGYMWKPFDSISDDDRDMDYQMIQIGAGYQLTPELYGSFYYENYDVDLEDGNTAFSAYHAMQLASGDHNKDKLSVNLRYFLSGMEFGLTWQYISGEFDPDFGTGFVPQVATEDIANNNHVRVGSLGYQPTPWGGWNSLETQEFDHQRLKAWMKVVF